MVILCLIDSKLQYILLTPLRGGVYNSGRDKIILKRGVVLMPSGKFRWLPNVVKRRTLFVTLCCLLLMFSLAEFAFSSPAQIQPGQSELIILGREMQTYDLDGVQWRFPLQLVSFGPGAGTARLVEFSIDAHNLLHLVPGPQRTIPVYRLDEEIDEKNFRKWNDYRRRVVMLRVRDDERITFSPAEEREYSELTTRVLEIGDRRRDISSVELTVEVPDLPFQVAGDGHHKVRVVVERTTAYCLGRGNNTVGCGTAGCKPDLDSGGPAHPQLFC